MWDQEPLLYEYVLSMCVGPYEHESVSICVMWLFGWLCAWVPEYVCMWVICDSVNVNIKCMWVCGWLYVYEFLNLCVYVWSCISDYECVNMSVFGWLYIVRTHAKEWSFCMTKKKKKLVVSHPTCLHFLWWSESFQPTDWHSYKRALG